MLEMMNRIGQKIANLTGNATPLDETFLKSRVYDEVNEYFQEELPYRIYDPETHLFLQENSMGFVFELSPLIGCDRHLESTLATLFSKVGSEYDSIQYLLWPDHRIDPQLDAWSQPRKEMGGLYKNIAERKTSFYKQGIRGSNCPPPRNFRFFLSYSSPVLSKEKLQQKREKFYEALKQFTSVKALDPQEFVDAFSGLVNYNGMTEVKARKIDPLTYLPASLCLHGSVSLSEDHATFRQDSQEHLFKAFEVVEYPDEWHLHANPQFLGDFFNQEDQIHTDFFVHYGFYFPPQGFQEAKIKTKQGALRQQLRFKSMNKLFSTAQKQADELAYVENEIKKGAKIIKTHFTVGLFSKPEKLGDNEKALENRFSTLGFKIAPMNSLHIDEFVRCLPMTWGESKHQREMSFLRSWKTATTTEAAAFVPLLAEWKGNSPNGMPLFGRRGQFATWDLFETEGNFNTVVVGPSGTGKSVFMAELLTSHLGSGGRAFVLDKGKSFKKICKRIGGQYLHFDKDSNLNLNPFKMIPETVDQEVMESTLRMVTTIVCTMAAPKKEIDEDRENMIGQAVKKAFQKKGRSAVIEDVIEALEGESYETERMKGNTESLISALKKYKTDSEYKTYFYGKNALDLKADFTVIETQELEFDKDLQAVILQIFSLMIANEIFLGDRSKKSIVCIDEARQLLVSPQMGGFIEGMARRLRKHNGALLIGTQSVKDFKKAAGAEAAFQNSNWFVTLGCPGKEFTAIKEQGIFEDDPWIQNSLKSLRMRKGQYSEALIRNTMTGGLQVVQIKLDPYSLGLFSTKAETIKAIEALQAEGLSLDEAIVKLIATQGVS